MQVCCDTVEFLLMIHPLVNFSKWVGYIGYCTSSVRVQGKKVIITEADDGSLVSCQTHPTHHSRSGGADGLLAVVDAVDISFVQAFQVRPESRLKQGERTETAWAKKLTRGKMLLCDYSYNYGSHPPNPCSHPPNSCSHPT